jgi:hypothetical protein
MSWQFYCFENLNMTFVYYFEAVTQPPTNRAQSCLTSVMNEHVKPQDHKGAPSWPGFFRSHGNVNIKLQACKTSLITCAYPSLSAPERYPWLSFPYRNQFLRI